MVQAAIVLALGLTGVMPAAAQPYPAQPYPQQPYPAQPYSPPQAPQPYVPPPSPEETDHQGIEASLFLGAVFPDRDYVRDVGRGVRFGGILGFRFAPNFSIGGGLDIDVHSPHHQTSADLTVIGAAINIVPSLHLPISRGEIILSGKLGASVIDVSSDLESANESLSGMLAGVAVTIALNVNGLRMGPMLQAEQHMPGESCSTDSAGIKTCADASEVGIDRGMFYSLLFAIWF